jgi:uncharacterized protein
LYSFFLLSFIRRLRNALVYASLFILQIYYLNFILSHYLPAFFCQANTDFYGSTIGMEILCLAVFTPILEELVFRGILFGRLKDMLSKPFAVGISALIFAAVHVNIVQFIYALILGVVLALLMDRAGNVYASMIGHMTANFIAVVRTETHWLDFSVRGDAVAWIFSLMILGVGIVLMWRYLSDRKKQEDKEKE